MNTVIYDGASESQIRFGGNDDPRDILTVGDEYELEDVEVHSYHTKIKLKGFDGWFNDVSFTYINRDMLNEALQEYAKQYE